MQTKIDSIDPNIHPPQKTSIIRNPSVSSIDHAQESIIHEQTTIRPDESVTKVTYYRNLLAKEQYGTKQRAASVQIAAQAYVEEATKVHRIGDIEVGIYAPFVLARSALRTIYKRQFGVILILAMLIIIALVWNFSLTLSVLMAGITAFYFINLLLTLYLSVRVFEDTNEIKIPDEIVTQLQDVTWPRYTILCPLYKETAVVKQFADAMQKLDYPVDKLQIMFLTESDDEATRDAIRAANLPSYFEIITVPDGQPRTKPRACNYGLLHATGEFVVIYDAEDVPDSLQLKKAVLAFVDKGLDIGCIQAKLNFYNSRQNILTRWFTVEYSTWFDTSLPGLQWAQFALPLGGTSNHFRLSTLRGIGAWDAYNVTEDCDLGLRLASQGYHTLVLDSTTYEEANPNLQNWIRQRSRWIKGYMQTYLIYMRQPFTYLNPLNLRDFISMQLIVGGRTAVLLINPLMWVMVVVYFAFRSIPAVVDIYQTLFPGIVLYFAVLCLVFGNLTYIYTHFIGCLKRGEFGLIKWTLAMPIYWAFASYAAFKALYQLITKPHYWEKTTHGLHLSKAANLASTEVSDSATVGHLEASQNVTQVPKSAWAMNAEAIPVGQMNGNGHSNGHHKASGATHLENASTAVKVSASTWVMNLDSVPNGHTNGKGHSNGNAKPTVASWNIESELPAVTEILPINGEYSGYANWFPNFVEESKPIDSRKLLLNRLIGTLAKEKWLVLTFVTACIAGLIATIYYFLNHDLLIYKDASSHLGIARLMFDNARPGLAHLGGVWLPLPHLLMLPFSAVDYFWRTGLAGACVSMPSYVITAVYIFLAARRLTHSNIASFVGSLVFILNPNVLYLQSTPLTEPLAAATVTAACYYFLAWLQEDKPKYLLLMAMATFLASLARYDGWSLVIGFVVLVPVVTLIKQRKRHPVEANTIIFALIACLGIAIWIVWCWVILGDPLYWQRSEYSSQAQQAGLIAKHLLYTYHDVYQSIRYFTVLTSVTMGPVVFVLSIAGLLIFLYQRRISLETIAGLAFFVPFAFYVFSLYSGQIILYLPELVPADAPDKYFNNRFGMVGVPPAAIFFAVLIAFVTPKLLSGLAKLRLPRWASYQYGIPILCSLIIIGQSVVTTANGIVSLQDGQFGRSCQPNQSIVDFMARNYDGGKILLDTFVNSRLYLMGPIAGVDFKNIVYQGSGLTWSNALQDPAAVVDWVVAVPGSKEDKVARAIDVDSAFFQGQFSLVIKDQWGLALYRRSNLPALVEHSPRPEAVFDNPLCSGF
ncbi:MAG: glycosyltransferase [Anaerolineae bacterium]|nr:glycosyltransferase [Anaerolineae bacterium]